MSAPARVRIAMSNTQHKKAVVKWHHSPVFILIMFLAAGPFALPLVWVSPALNRWQKMLITAAILLFTVWLLRAGVDIYNVLLKDIRALRETMAQ